MWNKIAGVKVIRKPTKIEGLVIQFNHSPLGIGTATAQFMVSLLPIHNKIQN